MDDELRARIREIGNQMVPQMFTDTIALYAPSALRPDETCRVERDIAYGADERHRLDLFHEARAGAGKAVIVYVHGGGFVQGDKGTPDAPFYNNFGAWCVREGFVGVTMTYRLAPKHGWPAGAEDIAALILWLKNNVADFGGDPAKIFLTGQSAGAAHVASYVAMPHLWDAGHPIAGAVMLSGIYDVVRLRHSPFENAYYGTDASLFPSQSSLPGLIETQVPCLFSIAEYDPAGFQGQAAMLVADWFARNGEWPHMLYLPDGNHMTGALGIGGKNDWLSSELSAFIRKYS